MAAPPSQPASSGGTPVRAEFLPVALPLVGPEERAEILAALESGWITTGPRVHKLEADLAARVGVEHAVCLNSCTAALHLALVALGLQPGDEVITSPITFCSTVNVIEHCGATPVLADVSADTLNLDPEAVRAALSERTRVILPVHYAGHPCDMDALVEIARERGIALVEDAAHAIGATYRGRSAGTFGDAGCFSFYATKNMTTAEGGALVTNRADVAESTRRNALHGMSKDAWKRNMSTGSWYYEVIEPGFKYNMTDLAGALGIGQLQRLDGFTARRRELAALFDAAFADEPAVETPARRVDVEHAYHLYPIRLVLERLSIDRARFIEELKAEGVGATVNFIPIHYHPYYRERLGLAAGSLPVAEAAYERLVSLPLYPKMSDADAGDVVAAVRKLVRCFAR